MTWLLHEQKQISILLSIRELQRFQPGEESDDLALPLCLVSYSEVFPPLVEQVQTDSAAPAHDHHNIFEPSTPCNVHTFIIYICHRKVTKYDACVRAQ